MYCTPNDGRSLRSTDQEDLSENPIKRDSTGLLRVDMVGAITKLLADNGVSMRLLITKDFQNSIQSGNKAPTMIFDSNCNILSTSHKWMIQIDERVEFARVVSKRRGYTYSRFVQCWIGELLISSSKGTASEHK